MTRTPQQLFDTAVGGVIAQGGPSYGGFSCYYRHPGNGRKCVVGHLIPDEKFNAKMEGTSITSLPKLFAEVLGIARDSDTWEMLCQLQSAHDNIMLNAGSVKPTDEQFLESFKTRVIAIAAKYGLGSRIVT